MIPFAAAPRGEVSSRRQPDGVPQSSGRHPVCFSRRRSNRRLRTWGTLITLRMGPASRIRFSGRPGSDVFHRVHRGGSPVGAAGKSRGAGLGGRGRPRRPSCVRRRGENGGGRPVPVAGPYPGKRVSRGGAKQHDGARSPKARAPSRDSPSSGRWRGLNSQMLCHTELPLGRVNRIRTCDLLVPEVPVTCAPGSAFSMTTLAPWISLAHPIFARLFSIGVPFRPGTDAPGPHSLPPTAPVTGSCPATAPGRPPLCRWPAGGGAAEISQATTAAADRGSGPGRCATWAAISRVHASGPGRQGQVAFSPASSSGMSRKVASEKPPSSCRLRRPVGIAAGA